MNERVLIADGDRDAYVLWCASAKGENLSVTEAEDGRQVLEIFSRNANFNLIILDVMTPYAEGYQVLKHIRQDDQPKAIPVIVSTAGGVPMVKKETAGRPGKGQDGKAKTREAKLGCVLTQTGVDKECRLIRDELSTSYTGAIEGAETFGWRIYNEAKRHGIEGAKEVNRWERGSLDMGHCG